MTPGELEEGREHPRLLALNGHAEELSLHGLDSDWFRVDVAAGDDVEVRVVSECEPSVNVWEPERQWPPVTSNRNTDEDNAERVRFTAPRAGAYLVEVSSFREGPCASYAISAVVLSEGAPEPRPPEEAPVQLP